MLLEESDLLDSLKGTLLWMAPEVICQESYGRKADIWSLGCTLIEIINGEKPWKNMLIENYCHALLKIGKSNVTPDIPSDLSEKLKSFLKCCLERDKTKRSVEELMNHPFLK
jgi:serine/threonine protein kinase